MHLISLAKDESRWLVKSERVVPSEVCVKKGAIHLTVCACCFRNKTNSRYDAIWRDTMRYARYEWYARDESAILEAWSSTYNGQSRKDTSDINGTD